MDRCTRFFPGADGSATVGAIPCYFIFLILFNISVVFWSVAPPVFAANVSLSCNKMTYGRCLNILTELFHVSFVVPESLSSKMIDVSVNAPDALAAVKQVTEALGIPNFAVLADATTGGITVSFPGMVETPAPKAPQADAVQEKTETPPGASSYDTPLFEGGPTPRQLDHAAAVQALQPVDPDAPLGLGEIDGEPLTLRKLEEIQKKAGPLPKVVSTPDMNITTEELEKTLERNKPKPTDYQIVPEISDADKDKPTFEQLKKNNESGRKAIEDTKRLTPQQVIEQSNMK